MAASDLACHNLEKALGPYTISTHSTSFPFFGGPGRCPRKADTVPDQPNIWTDGSREPIPHLHVEVAGAGAFVHSPAIIFGCNQWRHAQDLDGRYEGSSHVFAGITSPLQSVQRVEYCGVILTLQAFSEIHIVVSIISMC